MSIEEAVVTGTIPVTATTKSFEVAGFGTPQAAIVTLTAANGTNNPEDGIILGIGMTDGITDVQSNIAHNDAVADSETWRESDNTGLVQLQSGTGTDLVIGVWSAWSANGITINFTTVDGVAYNIAVKLIKGCTDLLVGSTYVNTTGVQDITDATFKGNLLYATGVSRSSYGGATRANMYFGAAHNNSSDAVTQACIHWDGVNLSANENTITHVQDSYIGYYSPSSTYHAAQDFDATGFSINSTGSPGAYVQWMLMDTGDTDGVDISIVDSPITTGDWVVTDPGWTPQSVMLLLSSCTAIDTLQGTDPVCMGMSMFDASNEASFCIDVDDNAATMDVKSISSFTNAVDLWSYNAGHAQLFLGSFSSFTASGYNLNFPATVDGTARKWVSIAIKSPVTPVPIGTKVNVEYNRAVGDV